MTAIHITSWISLSQGELWLPFKKSAPPAITDLFITCEYTFPHLLYLPPWLSSTCTAFPFDWSNKILIPTLSHGQRTHLLNLLMSSLVYRGVQLLCWHYTILVSLQSWSQWLITPLLSFHWLTLLSLRTGWSSVNRSPGFESLWNSTHYLACCNNIIIIKEHLSVIY